MPQVLAAALLLAATVAPAVASAENAPENPITAAIGVKTGIVPPVLAVPEIVFHVPHFFFGAFGIFTGGGLGNGGRRVTLGADLGYEFDPPERSTPYLAASFFHYEALTDSAGFYERSNLLTATAGYEWKMKHFELQLGGGLLFLLSDELPPPSCTGFCLDLRGIGPDVLPTFDLSARYRF